MPTAGSTTIRVAAFATAALAAWVALAADELPESAKRLQTAMQGSIAACRDQMLAEQVAAVAQYSNALVQASEACKKAGDLDGVLALAEEQQRLAKPGAIPDAGESGASPIVVKIRTSYCSMVARARERFGQQEFLVLKKYVDDLESLKRRLTIEGKIQEAVAVRDHLDLFREGIEKKAPPAPVSPPPEKQVGCPTCSSTGKKMGSCPKCSGSGNCEACGGTGLRKSSLKGTTGSMPCLTCMKTGTGKCSQCGGKGMVPGAACDTCEGTGKITASKAQYLNDTRAQKTVPKERPSWSYYARNGNENAIIQRGAALKEMFDNGNIVSVGIETVLLRPDVYKDKVCRSSAFFRYADRSELAVSVKTSVATQLDLKPYSEQEGAAMDGFRRVMKYDDPIVVIYGVLDAGQFIAFRAIPGRKIE